MPSWPTHRRRHGPTWRGAASVVVPGTAIGSGHVPRPGRAIGEPVAQVHGALRTGYRRFEECDVRGHRATVEHLLPDAEHDRVHPEVETVEELARAGGSAPGSGSRRPSRARAGHGSRAPRRPDPGRAAWTPPTRGRACRGRPRTWPCWT